MSNTLSGVLQALKNTRMVERSDSRGCHGLNLRYGVGPTYDARIAESRTHDDPAHSVMPRRVVCTADASEWHDHCVEPSCGAPEEKFFSEVFFSRSVNPCMLIPVLKCGFLFRQVWLQCEASSVVSCMRGIQDPASQG